MKTTFHAIPGPQTEDTGDYKGEYDETDDENKEEFLREIEFLPVLAMRHKVPDFLDFEADQDVFHNVDSVDDC